MSILFLDDNEGRIKSFRERHPDATIVVTAQAAIQVLPTRIWGAVYLDHDLNGERFVDSDRADCGMEVVRFALRHRVSVGLFVIHTANYFAALRMEYLLRNNAYNVVREPYEGAYDHP